MESILNPNAKQQEMNRVFFYQKAAQEQILTDSQPSSRQIWIQLRVCALIPCIWERKLSGKVCAPAA